MNSGKRTTHSKRSGSVCDWRAKPVPRTASVGEVGYLHGTGVKDRTRCGDRRYADTVFQRVLASEPESPGGYEGGQADGRLLVDLPDGRATSTRNCVKALDKLVLNDAALVVREGDLPRQPSAYGFRCGFLGLLHHRESSEERLQREYNLSLHVPRRPTVTLPRRPCKNGEVHLGR